MGHLSLILGGGGGGGGYGGGGAPSYGGYDDDGDDGKNLAGLLPLLALAPLALLALAPLFTTAAVTIGRRKRSIGVEDEPQEMYGFLQMLASGTDQHELQEKLMASYVACSDDSAESTLPCLEQLACKYEDVRTENRLTTVERDTAAMLLGSLMNNKHLNESVKSSIRRARYIGRASPFMCETVFACGKTQAVKNAPKLFK